MLVSSYSKVIGSDAWVGDKKEMSYEVTKDMLDAYC